MPTPYAISGTISDTDGSTALQSVLVNIYNLNTDEFLGITLTNASGQYVLDLANFSTDYTNGDRIEVFSYIDKKFYVHRTTVDTALGNETVDMTMIQISYTDPDMVSSYLNLKNFNMTEKPTISRIAELISRSEDMIDFRTGHSWRTRYSGTESGQNTTANYEYYNVEHQHKYQTGIPIFLKHRMVRSLASASGDAFYVFQGSGAQAADWEDWLGTKTEGRDQDYWLDYDKGVLFLRWHFTKPVPMKVAIKYRYGGSTVNKLVEDICIKMVLTDISEGEDRSAMIPEGLQNIPMRDKITTWREQIKSGLESLKEFRPLEIELI